MKNLSTISYLKKADNSVKRGQNIDASQLLQVKWFFCAQEQDQRRLARAARTQEVLPHKDSPEVPASPHFPRNQHDKGKGCLVCAGVASRDLGVQLLNKN